MVTVRPCHQRRLTMRRHRVLVFVLFAALAGLGLGAAARPGGGSGAGPNTLTAEEKKAGWKLLFDGKTLDGWRVFKRKDAKGWTVKDGAIYLEKPGSGDLITADKFGDFEQSVDWKFDTTNRDNNSGIIYRVGEQGAQTWVTGPEMQVMLEPPKARLGKSSGGALYDVYAPKENALKPGDQWNTFKVLARGKH